MGNIGFRIFPNAPEMDPFILGELAAFPVALLADCMNRLTCIHGGIRPFHNKSFAGVALTVRCAAGDNLLFHKALDMARPGSVLVVDGQGACARALCGEIMYRYAASKGIAGFVVDGCIRDVAALSELGFPVCAKGVSPMGPFKNGPGEINVPVACGGQPVLPGDLIVGDVDGVVLIRQADAAAVLEQARRQSAMERQMLEAIEGGCLDRDWIDQSLQQKGCAGIFT